MKKLGARNASEQQKPFLSA